MRPRGGVLYVVHLKIMYVLVVEYGHGCQGMSVCRVLVVLDPWTRFTRIVVCYAHMKIRFLEVT